MASNDQLADQYRASHERLIASLPEPLRGYVLERQRLNLLIETLGGRLSQAEREAPSLVDMPYAQAATQAASGKASDRLARARADLATVMEQITANPLGRAFLAQEAQLVEDYQTMTGPIPAARPAQPGPASPAAGGNGFAGFGPGVPGAPGYTGAPGPRGYPGAPPTTVDGVPPAGAFAGQYPPADDTARLRRPGPGGGRGGPRQPVPPAGRLPRHQPPPPGAAPPRPPAAAPPRGRPGRKPRGGVAPPAQGPGTKTGRVIGPRGNGTVATKGGKNDKGPVRPWMLVVAAVVAVALILATISHKGDSYPSSVDTVKQEIGTACQNPGVTVWAASGVQFACKTDKPATSQVLWVFSLLSSNDNPNYVGKPAKKGQQSRIGLEPVTQAWGDYMWGYLNLPGKFNPRNPVASLEVAARTINAYVGGWVENGQLRQGLESDPQACQHYTGLGKTKTLSSGLKICSRQTFTPQGSAALVADLYRLWDVHASDTAAQAAAVLFANPDNPGADPVKRALAWIQAQHAHGQLYA